MKALYENGTDAVLIGELLMKKSDRKAALMELKQHRKAARYELAEDIV